MSGNDSDSDSDSSALEKMLQPMKKKTKTSFDNVDDMCKLEEIVKNQIVMHEKSKENQKVIEEKKMEPVNADVSNVNGEEQEESIDTCRTVVFSSWPKTLPDVEMLKDEKQSWIQWLHRCSENPDLETCKKLFKLVCYGRSKLVVDEALCVLENILIGNKKVVHGGLHSSRKRKRSGGSPGPWEPMEKDILAVLEAYGMDVEMKEQEKGSSQSENETRNANFPFFNLEKVLILIETSAKWGLLGIVEGRNGLIPVICRCFESEMLSTPEGIKVLRATEKTLSALVYSFKLHPIEGDDGVVSSSKHLLSILKKIKNPDVQIRFIECMPVQTPFLRSLRRMLALMMVQAELEPIESEESGISSAFDEKNIITNMNRIISRCYKKWYNEEDDLDFQKVFLTVMLANYACGSRADTKLEKREFKHLCKHLCESINGLVKGRRSKMIEKRVQFAVSLLNDKYYKQIHDCEW